MRVVGDTKIEPVGAAQRVVEGQRRLALMGSREGLRMVADALVGAVQRHGCADVLAASDDASGSLAVATLLYGDSVRMVSERVIRSSEISKVWVFEPVMITGHRVARAVASSREAGADWVGVLTCADLTDPQRRIAANPGQPSEHLSGPDEVIDLHVGLAQEAPFTL